MKISEFPFILMKSLNMLRNLRNIKTTWSTVDTPKFQLNNCNLGLTINRLSQLSGR